MDEREEKLNYLIDNFESEESNDLESIIEFNKAAWPFFCKDSRIEISPKASEQAYRTFMKNVESLKAYRTPEARITENYSKRNAAKAARNIALSVEDPEVYESWKIESKKLVNQCKEKYKTQIERSVKSFEETQDTQKLTKAYNISMRLYSMALEFGEEYGFTKKYCADIISFAGKYARKIADRIKNDSKLPEELKKERRLPWLEKWHKNKKISSIAYEIIGQTELALEEKLSSANALQIIAEETRNDSYYLRANSRYRQILAYKSKDVVDPLSEKTKFIFSRAREKIKN